MKDQVAEHAKDWLTLLLTGLGITFSPHEWLGGMFLGLAGGAFAMKISPEKDKREIWVVLLGAFLASHLAGMVAERWFPSVPVTLAMVVAGFFSRQLAGMGMKMFGKLEHRSEGIIDDALNRVIGRKDDTK